MENPNTEFTIFFFNQKSLKHGTLFVYLFIFGGGCLFVLFGEVHNKLVKYINKSHFIYIATEFMPDNLRALLLSRHLLFEALTGSNLRGVPQGTILGLPLLILYLIHSGQITETFSISTTYMLMTLNNV